MLLNAFLADFTESGLDGEVPKDLRLTRIDSIKELDAWAERVRIAVERTSQDGKLNNHTLVYLGTVLDAASRRTTQSFSEQL